VVIAGLLDLTGDQGPGGTTNQSDRQVSYAGSGGYNGGLGGGPGGTPTPEAGNGPGGGAAGTLSVLSGSGGGGNFTGNQYLVPLVGGSGGGGAYFSGNCFGSSGGAGGGAILIASSTTITVNGQIDASGGFSNGLCGGSSDSGTGSGGAIRLVANTINGSGNVYASGSCCGSIINGSPGRIRFESFNRGFINVAPKNGSTASYLISDPFRLALPATAPSSLTVASVNGVIINANPFTFPDTTINTSSPVNVNVQAQYIPVGTIPKIFVFGESGPDQTIICSALKGTLQQSTCSASITFVTGGSRGFVKATW
jgi:hypothetical protein